MKGSLQVPSPFGDVKVSERRSGHTEVRVEGVRLLYADDTEALLLAAMLVTAPRKRRPSARFCEYCGFRRPLCRCSA